MTDEIFQAVDGISAETVDALRRQSAAALPDHPTERGYRAEQIKRALWEPMIGSEISLVGEVNRMIGALNARLALLNTLLSGGGIPVGEQQVTLDELCRLALADDIVNHNDSDSAHKDIREALERMAQNMQDELTELLEILTSKIAEQIAVHGDDATTHMDLRTYISDVAMSASRECRELLVSLDERMTQHNESKSSETHSDIRDQIVAVEAIARGKATARVFDTYDDMTLWLSNPDNIALMNIGDNLYIRALNCPDYWWDGMTIQQLEVEKPDLTDFYSKQEVDDRLPIVIAQADYDDLIEAGEVELNRIYLVIPE